MEQSEEDQDPVLTGYMTFLKKALRTLPDGLRAEVKARAGADVVAAPTTADTEAEMEKQAAAPPAAAEAAAGVKDAGGSSTAATKAVSAVAAAAGQLVGGMWGGGRAARGREEEAVAAVRGGGGGGGGHGLVRELVESCLFSLPHEREHVVADPGWSEDAMLGEGELEDVDIEDDGVRDLRHPFSFFRVSLHNHGADCRFFR